MDFDISTLDFGKNGGFITVVVQDSTTDAVLMTALGNRESVQRTLETGEMHFHSRTRGLWRKGATSGNRLRVVSVHADCDRDTLLARVEPCGPVCHTGSDTCFGRPIASIEVMRRLDEIIASRAMDPPDAPSSGYTGRLLSDRNLRLKKIGEEAAELIVACADDDAMGAIEEAADLIYHVLVALRGMGMGFSDVSTVLAARQCIGKVRTSASD